MEFTIWYVTIGGLLIVMALAGSVLKRLPVSSAMFYMATGVALGPLGIGHLDLDVIRDARLLERFTEVAVVISLFTAGLKLRLPLTDRRWRTCILMASAGMMLTVAAIAAVGVLFLGLSPGAAVLLGGILAPTDPVLASDVQVEHAQDSEAVRFGLTGEAGLNDGTAFPFVMLGLGLLGLHELGGGGFRWFGVDVLWGTIAGLAIGTLCGSLTSRLVLYLRRVHREAVGLDDFLALGLLSLSYGLALVLHAYGFLAVFAAGLALRRIEREHTGDAEPDESPVESVDARDATHPERAPAYMAQAVLTFNEQLERIGEVAVVLLIGAMLANVSWSAQPLWFIPVLLVIIRPAATFLSLIGQPVTTGQRAFIGWFGVRGIGSIYYLAYAVTHGVDGTEGRTLAELTLAVVATSIVVHGISVTPLMRRHGPRRQPA